MEAKFLKSHRIQTKSHHKYIPEPFRQFTLKLLCEAIISTLHAQSDFPYFIMVIFYLDNYH